MSTPGITVASCISLASRTPSSSRENCVTICCRPRIRSGRTKAEFFARLGYTRENWHALAADLRVLAEREEATRIDTTQYGTKYEVRGPIVGPKAEAGVVTAWITIRDEDFPRFVTAYPE